MNLSTQILAFLAETDERVQVVLAPGAPPVARRGGEMQVVSSAILGPMDIRETLATFLSHSRTNQPVAVQGSFAFGMAKMGRFRVHYFTQRGSSVVSIHRISFAVPDLQSILAPGMQSSFLDDLVELGGGGLVLLAGASRMRNVDVAYGFLRRVNDRYGKILCTIETAMSYLLRHEKSVVIQSEAGTDMPSVEEGIRNGAALGPDVLFVGDVKTSAELVAVIDAADGGALVVLSVVAFGKELLKADLQSRLGELFGNFCGLLRRVVWVDAAGDGGIGLDCVETL